MKHYNIIGILITDRLKHANKVHKILSKYGHDISTRLGLHNNKDESPNGLIIIEVDEKSFKTIEEDLKKLSGVKVKSMRL